jgi:class 3 adenylate cyclase/tetratricopeptide (TPR) repeat protein
MLAGACPGCGAKPSLDSQFCDVCGTPLRHVAALTGTPSRFAGGSRYTPAHLAERILTARGAIEGERKQVTVLFADIKSSMELLADRDPEEARQLLDPILELMMEAIHTYEGTVNQVMGDGIMALFGAPIALEDHALRAGYAALRMLASIARYGEETQRRHGIPVQIRIGMNSGEVVVRAIGSDLDMDYTALGQTTHVAARLEQLATPGTALCSAATVRLAEGFFRTRALGVVPIRGLAEPVEVLELTGFEPSRLRFHAAATRGLTPFVGRQHELGALSQVLRRAAEGHGQIAALVGEPGIGKSRLLWEVTRSPLTAGWLILEGGAVSYGTGTPYFPLRGLLRGYFGIDERDDAGRLRDTVTRHLLGLAPRFAEIVSPILSLLEVPVQDAGWRDLDPAERRRQTRDAIRRLLRRESERRPVLLVVEDLHWVDRETEAVLDGLAERLSTWRLAVLVNCRPEYQHGWGSRASYTQIRVDALGQAGAQELLRALLGDDAALEPLATNLIDRTGGNPLFLEESVRALVETGVLAGEPRRYRLTRALDRIQVPPSVQALLAARIDRLSADDKRVLQAAAAIGTTVPAGLLRAVAGATAEELGASLIRLREAEFLYETRLYPEVELAFVHALTCEVAYGSLVLERRRSLHAQILAALERLSEDGRGEQVERLAHHAVRGDVHDKAVSYCREAAAKAAARSAYREASAHLEEALAVLGRLPETRERIEQEIDLRLALRSSLFPLGEIARDLESLKVAEPLAESLPDRRRLAWVLTYMTRDLSILGQPDRAIECGERALGLLAGVEDRELEVLTPAYLGSVYFARGDYRQAADILMARLTTLTEARLLERFGLPAPASVIFRIWLVSSLASLGEFAEGAAQAAESLRIAGQADQPLARMMAHYTAGFLHAHAGDPVRAVQHLETSLDLCRTWKLPAWFSNIASILGHTYALSGRMEDGVSLMRQAIDQSRATGSMVNHASEVVRLGEACLLAGRLDEAQEQGEHARQLARAHREAGNEAVALRLLGDVEARRPGASPEAARRYYESALALAAPRGMAPLVTACQRGLAVIRDLPPTRATSLPPTPLPHPPGEGGSRRC